MPVLLPILSALKNPWVLLLIACALGIAGTSFYRAKYDHLVAANAIAIADAQKKADDLANQLIRTEAAARAATERTVTVYRDRIIHAPSTSTCGPSVGAAADGVRALLGGGSNAK
jgi:hypothetical protein